MMNKTELIHSLPKVKLVLGNGYDLHCKLHSSYKDYLNKRKDYFAKLSSLIDSYRLQFNSLRYFLTNSSFNNIDLNKINFWDLVFAYNSKFSDIDNSWFSLEEKILRMLTDKLSFISLPSVFNTIHHEIRDSSLESDFFASFLSNKYDCKNAFGINKFYKLLLKELKEFESYFGQFILNQRINTKDYSFEIGLENKRYKKCACQTLDLLCSRNNVVSVDNFNYDDCGIDEFKNIERNINGNINTPIFGVDSKFEPDDIRVIFTKTYRRMNEDMNCKEANVEPNFENLIIYGHSLDEADYSYFFPIFDKLHLTDNTAKNVIVFAFTIYDKSKEDEIKSTLSKRVYKIIQNYSLYKGYSNDTSIRLVDYLSIQKRIIMYEIPEITDAKLTSENFFDYGFEDEKQ